MAMQNHLLSTRPLGPVLAAGIFAAAIAGDAFAGPGMYHGLRHRLHSHDLHHGEGFMGSGVCPQTRATAQAPDDIRRLNNPLEPTPENLTAGAALFATDVQPTACKVCHGVTGNGLGMMAPGLNPPPRNFTCKETMDEIPDGQLFWIIKNGSPGTGMPPYGGLSDLQVWQIILHLRQFAQ
jgi:mono/diheme cytochrome c family protein